MQDFRLCRVNRTYFAEWYDGSGRHRRSLGTTDREAAKPAFVEFKRAFSLASSGTPVDLEAIYDAYLADRIAEGKQAAPRIRDAWKRLKPVFGPLMPSQITEEACRTYTRDRVSAGASPGTVHVELGYLRAAIRFAKVRRRWIVDEPYIPLPRKPEPRDHYLTKPEAMRLIEAAVMPHVRLFMILALATAGRATAILDLTWNRVDFERRKIILRDPEKPATPKGRATVPMNQMAHDALKDAAKGALSPFVIEWGGNKVLSVKKGVGAAAARAGLDCSPHVLRHTAAVWMAEARVPMEQISQFCGHRDVATTRRIYARFSPDYLQDAARALEL